MIFGKVFVIIFSIVLANHFDKPGADFNNSNVPKLQESISVKEQELLKYGLSRRADFKTRADFVDEKNVFDYAVNRIHQFFDGLLIFIKPRRVDFTGFRTHVETFQAEYLELEALVRNIGYKQQEIKERFSLVESLFTSLTDGSGFDLACEIEGSWIEFSLAEVFELWLTFMHFTSDYGDVLQNIPNFSGQVLTAKTDLALMGRKAYELHASFQEKWKVLEDALIVSQEFLDSL